MPLVFDGILDAVCSIFELSIGFEGKLLRPSHTAQLEDEGEYEEEDERSMAAEISQLWE